MKKTQSKGRSWKRNAKSSFKPVAAKPVAATPSGLAGDSEIAQAKAALRDAAKVLAQLAREEPRLFPGRPPPEEPKPPISPSRVIHVHPTGHHKIDVDNLERAIMKAGPGGTVVLRAHDKSGTPKHFNLSKVNELFMEHEVTLKCGKKAVLRFND